MYYYCFIACNLGINVTKNSNNYENKNVSNDQILIPVVNRSMD